MSAELRSFDVFDTVLTRLVGRPESLFLLLGQRAVDAGRWPHSPERFAAARVGAESRARAHAHPAEVTLKRIYAELAFSERTSIDIGEALAELEIELEGQLLRAVPAARTTIDEARRVGSRVAFISDIYLPPETVRGWLTREGLARPEDALWVSSVTGATKASGSLFDRVRAETPGQGHWRHVGDHLRSDVAVPRARGIEATHWPDCQLTRYEDEMERHAQATGGLASLLAGASRWVRLSEPAQGSAQATLRDIAAGVAGPTLWSFVTWVLRTAQREGLGRVWFTARDGQVMLRMARRIAPKLGLDLELGYLYGGRQVVHLAGLHTIDARALKWLTGGAGVVSASGLLERVGLAVADVADALQRHGIPLDGPLGWQRDAAVADFFLDPVVQSRVLAVAEKRRADMRSYFSACGLMTGEPCAVVDIGWRGSVLRSMFDIIGPERAAQHHFLYFGLFGRPSDVPEARMSAYCFDTSRDPALGSGHDIPSLTAVMEIFCQADHPQVVHVEPTPHGGHVPRLRPPPPAHPTLWDVGYFQDRLEAFADAVRVDLSGDVDADMRPVCGALLRRLMTAPDAPEATVLGSVQYIDDQSGATAQPFAHAYRRTDWRPLLQSGELPQKTLAWWAHGAWTLTPEPVRWWLRAARKIGAMRRAAVLRFGPLRRTH